MFIPTPYPLGGFHDGPVLNASRTHALANHSPSQGLVLVVIGATYLPGGLSQPPVLTGVTFQRLGIQLVCPNISNSEQCPAVLEVWAGLFSSSISGAAITVNAIPSTVSDNEFWGYGVSLFQDAGMPVAVSYGTSLDQGITGPSVTADVDNCLPVGIYSYNKGVDGVSTITVGASYTIVANSGNSTSTAANRAAVGAEYLTAGVVASGVSKSPDWLFNPAFGVEGLKVAGAIIDIMIPPYPTTPVPPTVITPPDNPGPYLCPQDGVSSFSCPQGGTSSFVCPPLGNSNIIGVN